jgi:hypothetical protein
MTHPSPAARVGRKSVNRGPSYIPREMFHRDYFDEIGTLARKRGGGFYVVDDEVGEPRCYVVIPQNRLAL